MGCETIGGSPTFGCGSGPQPQYLLYRIFVFDFGCMGERSTLVSHAVRRNAIKFVGLIIDLI